MWEGPSFYLERPHEEEPSQFDFSACPESESLSATCSGIDDPSTTFERLIRGRAPTGWGMQIVLGSERQLEPITA